MFSGKTIALTQYSGQFGLSVQRDCALSFVGKVPTRLDGRVVPCGQPRHIDEALRETGIVGIITKPELAERVPDELGLALADDPQAAAYRLHEALCGLPDFHWPRFPSRIDPTATVHEGAHIAPFDVVIGPGSVVSPGAVIRERTVIGAHCFVGPGTAIGTEAFELQMSQSPLRILPQAGGVRLEDHVEILANSVIVRATFGGFTRLGEETKIDNLVHVAHDCDIGRRVRIVASTNLGGRVTIGDDAYVGPGSTVSNGLSIGEGAAVTLGSVVIRGVPARERVSGNFAVQHHRWLRFIHSLGS